jgi:drug/metabolite transporter (DMT)-like permease
MSRPIVEAILAIAFLAVMDSVIKGLVARYPVTEVAFVRYVVGSLTMLCLVAWKRPGWPRPDTIRANAVRALLVIATAVCFFYALGALPLAETLVLSFLSPVFTSLFAAVLLKERIDLRVVGALAAGFGGVLVIIFGKSAPADAPNAAWFGGSLLGVLAVLTSSVTYSASNVLLRSRAQRDPVLIIVAIQNFAPCLMLATPALVFGRMPDRADLPALMVLGLLGVSGHLLLARAYAKVQAVRLAPLDYTALLWAVIIGYAAYDEVPSAATAIGAVMILGAAFIASRRPTTPAAAVTP